MKNNLFSLTLISIVLFLFSFSTFGQVCNLYDVRTPMRDGVELSSDIWLPEKPGKYPAILLRTPSLDPSGGQLRARYRNGLTDQELLTPNKTELFKIKLYGLGYAFLKGHRIRLEISSSSYPIRNPNQNTGNPIATDIEWKIAYQTIYHEKINPSHIFLPIISDDN